MGNKIATLQLAEEAEAGRDVAMQAAAMNPLALTKTAFLKRLSTEKSK